MPEKVNLDMLGLSDHDLLLVISTELKDMKHRLLGNGQPGEIEIIRNRVLGLENFKSYTTGMLALISVAISAFGATLLGYMFQWFGPHR